MYAAAASSALRPMLAGPARPAELLGLSRVALYLKAPGQPGVLVVLCHDAVRLPCGLLLATTSAEMPLTSLAPQAAESASFMVGDGSVSWLGPAGRVVVRAAREWAPVRPARGQVAASALAAVRSVLGGALRGGADPGIDGRVVADLANAARDYDASLAVAARLLGSGPGLTPSGDDVLAGFLAGAAAFGLEAAALRQAVADLAPARTTALSAALLWHAARGECIDELAAVAAVLAGQRDRPEQAGRTASRLLSVGHTSGAALTLGLVIAAEHAVGRQPVPANTGLANTGLAKKGRAA
jgi:Protein of unknown function (DUF2877)